MAFAAGFGLDIALTAVSLVSAFVAPSPETQCRVGIGSKTRTTAGLDLSGGDYPHIFLYDTRGELIDFTAGGGSAEQASNEIVGFMTGTSTTPEYVMLQASTTDATCISYISLTSAANDQRTWHAGYVKQCAAVGNQNQLWYPSPEIIPGTDFRPGCVWLSDDDRFLRAISFKLTDFGFPDSETAQRAQAQYTQFPNTLCQAPARMALWTTPPADCVPVYLEDEQRDANGFDLDFQKIVDGHALVCDMKDAKTLNQNIQPGQGPKTLNAKQLADEKAAADAAQAVANEAGTNTNAPPPGAGGFGGTLGSIPAGSVDDGAETTPAVGVGNFGGVLGFIPNPDLAQPTVQPTVQPTRRSKRASVRKAQDVSSEESRRQVLHRREALGKEKDQCVDRLVISHFGDHSATEVCQMSNSWGPDFVSLVEGLYCDMCERELWQLCSVSTTSECFDLEKKEVRHNAIGHQKDDQVDLRKKFEIISEWK
ncbi:hypothetical protein ONS95_007185 [Cadophora gregata]|uniref:uncharacterized protein n=1 Tax=Cadophora gregata TaxID=51156 RepID=UPI0026DD46B3|nr:uncharacterized protein ONS95_007185 [Cadophora gregata]KAK0100735.1 hypothetical protein ONS95_007185 [Cadophora gregata]KAK0117269.1 hypothetical protein ONS96_013102 [Cadophora gregata f. sp. sojae]